MTYGLDTQQLRELVIRPALQHIGLWSQAAENLVLGTACVESGCAALKQRGKGPALGLWQMEPATHDDLWRRMSHGRGALIGDLCTAPDAEQMAWNLRYGAAMCRIHYYLRPFGLPSAGQAQLMAETWKREYNTARGKGTILKALPHFKHACA